MIEPIKQIENASNRNINKYRIRLKRMETIGQFNYLTFGTFEQALILTKTAEKTYGGIITIPNAVTELGYNVKDESSISGQIYKRINDLTSFGLFVRDRGVLRVTELGKKATNDIDKNKSMLAIATAIRNISIIGKAFDEWKGQIPDKTALPARIANLTKENYKECEKHVTKLEKLFREAFPILAEVKDVPSQNMPNEPSVGTPLLLEVSSTNAETNTPKGELRTSIGSIVITNKSQVKLARQLLDVFEEELENSSNHIKEKKGSTKPT